MTDPNPYASPQFASHVPMPFTGPPVGVWRQGEYLVLHRAAALPPICVFSGEPAANERLRVDYMGPGDRYTFQLVMERHQAAVFLPVNPEILAGYNGKTTLLYLGLAIGLMLTIGAVIFAARLSGLFAGICAVGAVIAFAVAAVNAATRPSLALYDISAHYLWLRGASPLFLAQLPEWPFAPA